MVHPQVQIRYHTDLSGRACGPRNLMKIRALLDFGLRGGRRTFDPVSRALSRQISQHVKEPTRGIVVSCQARTEADSSPVFFDN
jgi:hypothetical protein